GKSVNTSILGFGFVLTILVFNLISGRYVDRFPAWAKRYRHASPSPGHTISASSNLYLTRTSSNKRNDVRWHEASLTGLKIGSDSLLPNSDQQQGLCCYSYVHAGAIHAGRWQFRGILFPFSDDGILKRGIAGTGTVPDADTVESSKPFYLQFANIN